MVFFIVHKDGAPTLYRVSRIRTDTEQEHVDVEEPKIRRFNPTYIYTKL